MKLFKRFSLIRSLKGSLAIVLAIKPCGVSHPKLSEIIHQDFFDLSTIKSQLNNYKACFFCLGVTSVGLKEEEYSRLSYDLTVHMADLLASLNSDMVFCYVSGTGTDSTEQGKSMWARVKGRTENHLLQLPFKKAYMFRPGYIHPTKGLKNTHKYYKALTWLYPILRRFFLNVAVSLKELGIAMIHTVTKGYDKSILECKDIIKLAKPSLDSFGLSHNLIHLSSIKQLICLGNYSQCIALLKHKVHLGYA